MFQLVIATTLVALTAAAQLPSATYLPSAASGLNPGASGTPGATGAFNGNQLNGRAEDNGNTRAQQAVERSAAILRLNNQADENGFQYAYETSNGIQAQESGNAAQTQGGFSYTGDDGQVYTVTFTAGENGFRPEGAHLPVPPPTPVEILLALKQNEQDEAAGIFDDGLYHPEKNENGNKAGQNAGQGFGSVNHQGNYNSNAGYKY